MGKGRQLHLPRKDPYTDSLDGHGSYIKQPMGYGAAHTETRIFINVFVTKVLGNTSMRAIHDQIMHTEATRMAQLYFILQKLRVFQTGIKHVKTLAFVKERDAQTRTRHVCGTD